MSAKGILSLFAVLGGLAAASYLAYKKYLAPGAKTGDVATSNPGPNSESNPNLIQAYCPKTVITPVKTALLAGTKPVPAGSFRKNSDLRITGRMSGRTSHVWDIAA